MNMHLHMHKHQCEQKLIKLLNIMKKKALHSYHALGANEFK